MSFSGYFLSHMPDGIVVHPEDVYITFQKWNRFLDNLTCSKVICQVIKLYCKFTVEQNKITPIKNVIEAFRSGDEVASMNFHCFFLQNPIFHSQYFKAVYIPFRNGILKSGTYLHSEMEYWKWGPNIQKWNNETCNQYSISLLGRGGGSTNLCVVISCCSFV
jgi:hypothetical protein